MPTMWRDAPEEKYVEMVRCLAGGSAACHDDLLRVTSC